MTLLLLCFATVYHFIETGLLESLVAWFSLVVSFGFCVIYLVRLFREPMPLRRHPALVGVGGVHLLQLLIWSPLLNFQTSQDGLAGCLAVGGISAVLLVLVFCAGKEDPHLYAPHVEVLRTPSPDGRYDAVLVWTESSPNSAALYVVKRGRDTYAIDTAAHFIHCDLAHPHDLTWIDDETVRFIGQLEEVASRHQVKITDEKEVDIHWRPGVRR